ncbi:MAG: hypothetical protein QM820_50960 [Minicystis sp.]
MAAKWALPPGTFAQGSTSLLMVSAAAFAFIRRPSGQALITA